MDNKNNTAKPFSVLRRELQETIVNAINSSNIPLSVSMYILKDIMEQVSVAVAQQENAEIAEYEAKLAELGKQE